MVSEIIQLRKQLHQHPEISGQEFQTAQRIQDFISTHFPGEFITTIGGPSFAVIYEFGSQGKTVAIRCELDALPIVEENNFDYNSIHHGVSHKCGHDGHMAIVTGLIFWLKTQTFTTGRVVLIFQSAEETGKGAYAMLNSPKFKALTIDYIFALHNIPGVKMNTIIGMNNGFSAEVESFVLKLQGITSHAAEPQNGINPASGLSELVTAFETLNNTDPNQNDFQILTPVHLNMGEANYGISPGNAELHYTVRTWSLTTMTALKKEILKRIDNITTTSKLKYEITWLEHFPASENDADCNAIIKKTALQLNLNTVTQNYPFKFGEDFGWFSRYYKTGMFGLGSGKNTPPLHNPSYDFPNEIISTGIAMFGGIIKEIIEEK